jgi:hypothetical protein
MKKIMCIALLFFPLISTAAPEDYPICKLVGKNWAWFSDHAVSSIKYYVVIETGAKVVVGTGIKIFDKPRGSIITLSGEETVNAYGIGSIHIRSTDTSSAKVCLNSGKAVPITIIREYF